MKSVYFKVIAIFDDEHLLLFPMIDCCGLFVYCEDAVMGLIKSWKANKLARRDRWDFWAEREI